MNAIAVYITAKDLEQAKLIGRTLVEERLVACVNIIEKMNSIYWWQGAVCDDTESIIIAKTISSHFDRVVSRVKELHSYEVPCVVAFPIEHCSPDYLAWIRKEVGFTET